MKPDTGVSARSCIGTIVALACLLVFDEASATIVPGFKVSGRVAVSEPASCDGGNGDLTQNALISWTECHALKQHMDAAGQPIATNAFVPTALRPLSLTVRIQVYCYYNGGQYSDLTPVTEATVQTDDRGSFSANVQRGTCGQSIPGEGIHVQVTASLSYSMKQGRRHVGTIRAIWDKALGQTVYNSGLSGSEPILYSSFGRDWVTPRFILSFNNLAFPLAPTLDLGNQVFFAGAVPDYYDYLRGALGAWQTMVRLHQRLRKTLDTEGYGPLYERIFVTYPPHACVQCYTLGFNNPQGGGVGGSGGFSIDQPVQSPSSSTYGGLVSVGLMAHEFGHSMHASIASGSFAPIYTYDDSMQATLTPQGVLQAYHIGYQDQRTGVLQQQELGIAFTEGFGDAMGSYFLTGCKIGDRAWGNPDPLNNMWNVQNFQSCDSTPGCPYGAFRFQMSKRGIGENSRTWNARLANLTALAQKAAAAGTAMVISNNELKLANFFCDLLDRDPDVSFAAGQIGGRSYVANYTWHVAERLDGRNPPFIVKTYANDPKPERVAIGLGKLLTAMNAFATRLSRYPTQIPVALYLSPTIVDGANKPYNDMRISVNGVLSPQSLGRHMVNSGYLTRDELNNILRSNRMDELP